MAAFPQRWQVPDTNDVTAQALGTALGLPRALGQVLLSRGITEPAQAERFLNPRLSHLCDPFVLPGITEAVDTIWRAVDDGVRMVVFGDYDVDGVSATALLVSVLRRLGAEALPFLPNRFTDGYGLTLNAARRCVEQLRPKLLLTVDCGTGARDVVSWVRQAGVDVVVTDHHEPAEAVVDEVVVVNPKVSGDGPGTELAGVGVAFKLCHALVKRGRDEGRAAAQTLDLRAYLDLVSLGTVADVAPLIHENRILVHHGLDRLSRTEWPGVRALMDVAGMKPDRSVNGHHLAFVLGPRLNAPGRMGAADPSLDLLLIADAGPARSLARQLDNANTERRAIETKTLELAENDLALRAGIDGEGAGLVAAGDAWHSGTIGIVASRLCRRYHRAAAVIAFDEQGHGRGSCRSVEPLDLVALLQGCSDLLTSFGGHRMAGGFSVERGRLEAFRERFNRLCAERMAGVDMRPVMAIDSWIPLSTVDETLLCACEKFRPWGAENPAPTWAVRGVELVGAPRVVGERHVKMLVTADGKQMEAIGFEMGDRKVPDGPLDLAFQLQENEFRGCRTLQLKLRDFRPSSGHTCE